MRVVVSNLSFFLFGESSLPKFCCRCDDFKDDLKIDASYLIVHEESAV
jgi:hypothetical protein